YLQPAVLYLRRIRRRHALDVSVRPPQRALRAVEVLDCGAEVRARAAQNQRPYVVQRYGRPSELRVVGDLSSSRNPSGEREIGVDDVRRLRIQERLEPAHPPPSLPAPKRDNTRAL